MKPTPTPTQTEIIKALGVNAKIDVKAETERRISFLADYLQQTDLSGYVLGVSGGVDSTTAARLAQMAVEKLRQQGKNVQFFAVRLPYGEQKDEADAQRALAFIRPDHTVTINIKPATDAMRASVETNTAFRDAGHADFVIGNVKARQRMIAQYALAGAHNALVIGTDHAAEALMGFYTKHGDGAADITPLAGLNKRQVRAIARHLGAEESVVMKVPTADLESLAPQKADEDVFGMSYDVLDDFLEGKDVAPDAAQRIIRTYGNTAHKRAMPLGPND